MRDGTYRDRDGQVARVTRTANGGYLITYPGRTVTVSAPKVAPR